MSKKTEFVVKTTVKKFKDYTMDKFTVTVEGSGFSGQATSFGLGTAFEEAYRDLMMQVSESIFTGD